jgi:uncharacterized protein with HEPN domain
VRSKKFRDSDYLEHIANHGARNVIVHGYAEIEPDRIWDIVKSHIPSLGVAVGRLRQLINEKGRAELQRDAQSEEEPDRREDLGR